MSSIWYLLPLVVLHTGLSSIIDHTAKHQCALFGRIACLSEAIPTNQGLCCHIDESLDQPPQSMWKCRPRCWCNSWIEQIRQDSGFSSAELWHSIIESRRVEKSTVLTETHLKATGCHLPYGSTQFTCHPTKVNTPCPNPSQSQVLDLRTPEGWKAELT